MLRRVFVYGTLRRGGRNSAILRQARYLGPLTTRPTFTLYDLGAYPGAISGGCTALEGEVYEVGQKLLQRLDVLEDVPYLYDRVIIQSCYGPVSIYLLIRRPVNARRINHGDWMRYRGFGFHSVQG